MTDTLKNLNFAEVERLVADSLEAAGYQLTHKESQQWPCQYSLDSPNIDGTTEIFFGRPFCRQGDGYEMAYLIVRGDTLRGEVHLPDGFDAPTAASVLLGRLHEILVDLLPGPTVHAVNVGAGLLPVSDDMKP